MCKNCYHARGREKPANKCPHIDRANYVKEGETLTGSIAVRQAKENHREIDVKISYHFSNLNESQAQVQLYKVR